MVSSDLTSLRGALECYVERLDGRLFLDVAEAADLLRTLGDLADRARRMEGAVAAAAAPVAARCLPDGVADLTARRAAMRRERAAGLVDRVTGRPRPTDPAGGPAA